MLHRVLYCAGTTPALSYTRAFLQEAGWTICHTPQWDTTELLLDVPSLRPGGMTADALHTLLSSLPQRVRVWGGNLNHPSLEGYRRMDLLKDEGYLMENAAITARCTIPILDERRTLPWPECAALVIGWGRIGKALAHLLQKQGCLVTVATTNPEKLPEIAAAGYAGADIRCITSLLPQFQFLINTAPALILTPEQCQHCPGSLKIDLASKKGIDCGEVIWARGLPGKLAPEASGRLIADTFLRLWKEEAP